MVVQLNELIGGEKGEGQQMAVWEKIFDVLSGLIAEADAVKKVAEDETKAVADERRWRNEETARRALFG